MRSIYALIAADHAAQVKRVRELTRQLGVIRQREDMAMIERDDARKEVERLQAEASRPCPADGMSDYAIGEAIEAAIYPKGTAQCRADGGRKARELFGDGAK